MKNLFLLTCAVLLITSCPIAQKYYTKTAKVDFDATAKSSPEKIIGINRTGTCVIDSKSGNMQFVVLMKGFEFERALMEEHFNENYVESNKYPKAEFKGDLKEIDKVNFLKDGRYTVKIKGKLSIHGESNEIETTAIINVAKGKINTTADFNIKLSDYKISIPGLVADKVAKTAQINISCSLELLKN